MAYNARTAGRYYEFSRLLQAGYGIVTPVNSNPAGHLYAALLALGGAAPANRNADAYLKAIVDRVRVLVQGDTGVYNGNEAGYLYELARLLGLTPSPLMGGNLAQIVEYLTASGGTVDGSALRPAVYVLNDFTKLEVNPNTDYDNMQWMPVLALYAHAFDYVGWGCSYPGDAGKTTTKNWIETVYAADVARLQSVDDRYPSAAALSALVTQGSTTPAVSTSNLGSATETSVDLIAKAAALPSGQRLRILVGGPAGDLALAMRDGLDPAKVEYIYVSAFKAGRYNWDEDAFAAQYIVDQFASGETWGDSGVPLIMNGETYYGMYIGADPMTGADKEFVLRYCSGHGAMGDSLADFCIDSFQPGLNRIGLSAGDHCASLYTLDNDIVQGNGRDPTQTGWGGRYQIDLTKGPNVYVDVASGETVNSHPGAGTLMDTRAEWQADLAARLQSLCTVPPSILTIDALQGLSAGVADITGTDLVPGPGTWANYRTAGDRDMQISLVNTHGNDAWSYIVGTDANSSMFYIDGVEAPSDGNAEIEVICRTTNTSLTDGGPMIAVTGDLTTGKRFDGYGITSANWSVSKEINGVASDDTVAKSGLFALSNNGFYRLRLRRLNNGDGTRTITLAARNKFASPSGPASWVTLKTRNDTTSVIEEPGGFGLRGTQTIQFFGVAARTIPNIAPAPPAAPVAPVLTATPGNTVVDLAWTTPYNGGSAITGYKVYRGTSPGFTVDGSSLIQTLGVTNSYQDTGRTNGVAYYYVVKATNAIDDSPASTEKSATPSVYTDTFPAYDAGIQSGLILDLNFEDPTKLTTTGSLIDAIAPSQGTLYGATSTGSLRPSVGTLNGNPCAVFAGGQELIIDPAMLAAHFGSALDYWVMVVGVLDTTASSGVWVDLGIPASISTRDRISLIAVSGGGSNVHRRATSASSTDTATSGAINTTPLIMYARGNATNSACNLVKDGSVYNSSALACPTGLTAGTIGNRKSSSGNLYLTGRILRVQIGVGVPTGTNLSNARTWAQGKAGTP